MIEATAPGKLFIAGEYAVVEAGHPAILVAIDQFITVKIAPAKQAGSLLSEQYSDFPVRWTRQNNELVLDIRENPFHYLLAAIHVVEAYAQEQGKALRFFDLIVTSELDNANGRKYGLGSSGAVTVATVQALAKFYGLTLSKLEQFKLAALAHLRVKANGSCGDIAASVYGGWLAFTTFDAAWVHAQKGTIGELLQKDWPKLSIQPLTPPEDLRLLIGWTGSPASTSLLVDEVHQQRAHVAKDYQQFLQASQLCVEAMIHGFHANDLALIQAKIRENRHLLQALSSITGVTIETPALTKLCELAETYEGAAKSSGAGGGDCGIVIFKQKSGVLPLISAWEKSGITPLPLHVYARKEDDL